MASESSFTASNTDLEGLSDIEATIQFTNPNDLARTLHDFIHNTLRNDNYDHTVLITGFPIENFTIDDHNAKSPIPKSRKALYLKDQKILILTMPGLPHEVASSHFSAQLVLKLNQMNCLREIRHSGGVTMEMEGIIKEPDGSWGPRQSNITCVLEAAVSESDRTLHQDARIWLEHPESKVTQVITVKIHRARADITFSVWKQTQVRAQHPPRAIIDHDVRVTLVQGRPMAEGNIRLSFELFFKRRPQPGTTQRDIVISARELGGIARVVWEDMGLISE
jgi:hypothetical protein